LDSLIEQKLPDIEYNVSLIKREKDKLKAEILEHLLDYLLIILLSHTPYFNAFIKNYAEMKKSEVIKNLPNKISIWEFIKTASKSRNNDLHLERLDLENGYVDITEIKEI